ncbi:MAG: hypothetical protein Q9178_005657 [Gyalolechia marmorata]
MPASLLDPAPVMGPPPQAILAPAVRLKSGRLQYRDSQTEGNWVHLEDSYESAARKDRMAEPWNVEQVHLRQGSIEVSQFHRPYSGRDPLLDLDAPDMHRWKLTFGGIYDIVISERVIEHHQYKRPRVFCVVRFKCRTAEGVEENRINPENAENTPVDEDEDDEQAPAGEEEEVEGSDNGNDVDQVLAMEKDEGEVDEEQDDMEEDSEETQSVQLPVPSAYPLATLSSDYLGKEFRLAILKTTPVYRANKKNSYSWAWPGAVRFLADMEFWPFRSDDLDQPLDSWARNNKDSLKAVGLVEVPPTPENGLESIEWALRPISRAPQHLTIPAAPPSIPRLSMPPAPPTITSPTMSGSKWKYDEMEQPIVAILADIRTADAEECQERQACREADQVYADIDRQYQELKKRRRIAKAQKNEAAARLETFSNRKLGLMEDLVRLSEEEQRKTHRHE